MRRFAVCLFLFALLLLPVARAVAQTSALNQAQTDRTALEAQLSELESEITAKEAQLANQQGQSETLSNDIAVLKTKIDKANLDIKAKNIVIQQLSGEISDKTQTIQTLSEKVDSEKESLAQLLRKTDAIDHTPFLSVVLSDDSLSKIYSDVDSFASINLAVKQSLDTILGTEQQTETEKQALQTEQDDQLSAKAELEQAKNQVTQSQTEQKHLLALSKEQESAYEKDLAEKRATAAQIQARLFSLAGGGTAIPFGDAVQYAQVASAKTGVRPAFLLAILQQETGIGANQGSCMITGTDGNGVRIKTGAVVTGVMKPTRDVAPFIAITQSLGLDPYKQIVSCPQGGGYGGGMGPSQFIPSTWQLLASRVGAALGVDTPDPWTPTDAFMASSIYLSDLGASTQAYADERNAACKYYSGRRCDSKKPANSFYGNSVMKLADGIQSDIDYLKQYGVSRR